MAKAKVTIEKPKEKKPAQKDDAQTIVLSNAESDGSEQTIATPPEE